MSEMFEKANLSVNSKFLEIMEENFPELSGFSFGLIFRKKIKKSKGGVVLAEVCLPSKLLSFYAVNEQGNPYDYLMIFDEMAWATANDVNRTRIMRHELRHVFIDEKGNAKMVGHDFEDFHKEVELNQDDPMWAAKVAEVAIAGYNSIKDGGADPRTNPEVAGDLTPGKPVQRQVKLAAADESFKDENIKKAEAVMDAMIPPPEKKTDGVATGPALEMMPKPTGAVKGQLKTFGLDDESSDVTPIVDTQEPTATMKLNDLARSKGLLR